MERPYVFMQRALVTFKAAGLHSPLAGAAQEEFWLQLWVERYGALEAGLFTVCIKKLAGERMLLFDEELLTFSMGNCITMEDTNGNRKLLKKRSDQTIDAVAAMMDADVAYKHNPEAFA